jgi:cell division protein FtsQ
MTESPELAPTSRTWRDIPQQVHSRAMSREGRRRFHLAGVKMTAVALALGAAGWGAYEIVTTWRSEPGKIAAAINTKPIDPPVLVTDGVLDQNWLMQTLALPTGVTLMELNIYQLQTRLTQTGQVKSVVITKVFPNTLTVTIAERSPVAQIRVETGEDLLVARDGVVFAGIGYDPAMVRTLPWLKVPKLVREGAGYAPIANMEVASDLLSKARNEAPQLFSTWKVVDLTRIDTDSEIEVQSSDIARIVFSTQTDFFTQLARLDYARDKAAMPMKMINLSLGSQVVMIPDQPETAVVKPLKPSAPRSATPVLPAFPNVQRSKSSRDL